MVTAQAPPQLVATNLTLLKEQRVLDATMAQLDARARRYRDRAQHHRADFRSSKDAADVEAGRLFAGEAADFENVLRSGNCPYYARFDVLEDGSDRADAFYLSTTLHAVDTRPAGANLIHWTSQLGRAFSTQGLRVQSGELRGQAYLKRRFQHERRQLTALHDAINRYGAVESVVAGEADSFLRSVLGTAGARAHSIIASIAETQDTLVRTPAKGALVINGVPGSGKTQVGQMRIAFLVTNVEVELAARATADRCLILTPSRTLLSYLEGVLPSFGVSQVRGAMLAEYLASYVGLKGIPSRLGDPSRTSVEFGTVVESFVASLAAGAMSRLVDVEPPSVNGWKVSKEDLVAASASLGSVEVGQQANALATNLAILLLDKHLPRRFDDLSPRPLPQGPRRFVEQIRRRREAERTARDTELERRTEQIRADLLPWCEAHLPRLDTVETYRVFLAARGLEPSIGEHDLPALALLHFALTRRLPDPVTHLVIDEGQDVSPLAYTAVKRLMPGAGVTILGDLAQRDPTGPGIVTWDVLPTLGYEDLSVANLVVNYRSTTPIVAVLNSIRRHMVPPLPEITGIERPGTPVMAIRAASPDNIARTVAEILKARQPATAAVLCRSPERADALHSALTAMLPADRPPTRLIRTGAFSGGVIVGTRSEVAGLEFDLVVIADADAEAYPLDEGSAADLFFMASRAQNVLAFVFSGSRTALLADAPLSEEPDGTEHPN